MKDWTKAQEDNYMVNEWATYVELDHPDYMAVVDYLKPGMKVLDCGCNSGVFVNWMAKEKGVDSYGLDLPRLINKAGVDDPRLYACDLNEEFTYDNNFDLVYALAVIEHLYNDYLFLCNVYYALKMGGLFIISLPTTPSAHMLHIRFYPEQELEKLMKVIGFELIEKRPHPLYPGEFNKNRIFVWRKIENEDSLDRTKTESQNLPAQIAA